jgi:5-oxoprolinase (ATP-hydrolysing)
MRCVASEMRVSVSAGRGWQFWIDRGGTFTDVVARGPDGAIHSAKLLSDNPRHYRDAAVAGIRHLLGTADAAVDAVKMGTTVATNALLERRGEPTVLVLTAGLGGAIRIGTQQRPKIFALDIDLPDMLYERLIEAHERISAHGGVIEALDEARLAADLHEARKAGLSSAAIVLLHGYRYPAHERRAAEIARRIGFTQVSISSEVSPLIKLVERGNTTLADAYLSPVLRRYVDTVRDGLSDLGDAPLLFMQSHGGLVGADGFRGKDSVLSGPAGGVVGMVAAATDAGFERVIGFDMGGTSTDVSLYDGEYERTTDTLIGGIRISAPMMNIHTVAAGGGSVLAFASGRLQVGPASAGALPGPACYRNGGPLTVTDANVLLGRIQPDFFPAVFGSSGREPLDVERVRAAFDELAGAGGSDVAVLAPDELAAGFVRVAVERMANAIKKISIARGYDVTRFALSCFGGAGGQHACQVADALGIGSVLIHPLAGVLSAYGMGVADLRSLRQAAVELPLDEACAGELDDKHAGLSREAEQSLRAQQLGAQRIRYSSRVSVKVAGSDTALPIHWQPGDGADALRASFAEAHRRHFGFDAEDGTLIAESIDVEAVGVMPKLEMPAWPRRDEEPRGAAMRSVYFAGGRRDVPIYRRETLSAGHRIAGPAIVVDAGSTTVIEPEWGARLAERGDLILERLEPRARVEHIGRRCDPIMLEVFNNLFMHIAEEMGVVLRQTAHSVNIKERLDFSCAIFDGTGELIANAPHVPVHLGSMGDSVRSIIEANGTAMHPGDVYMQNAPYKGGTHLPDITVVSPAFDTDCARPRFFVASRAHHADIGGVTPGSMPAASRTIDEEGVLLDNVQIAAQGRFLRERVLSKLRTGPYPARNPAQNVADLKAQIAANAKGLAGLDVMVERFGASVVEAYMTHIKRNAEACVRDAIDTLDDGRASLELDGGERIQVAVRIDRRTRSAVVDFAGTGRMSPGNFNAPAAIARACVLYVFRTLVAKDIPLNAGCLKPLTILLPEHSLLAPDYPAAVVAGNVETSQCIADALLAALGACAASQGTMNNFTFGNARYQYYETLCGGAGAGPCFDGASAVHTHMTNSRLTDAEVLEWRYPVRVRRFAVRHGSGGIGRHRGGDGIVRELEFLEPMQGAILSNRRVVEPFGLAGGGAGARGRNTLIRRDGRVESVPSCAELVFEAGDRFVIETPGGGGYGASLDVASNGADSPRQRV